MAKSEVGKADQGEREGLIRMWVKLISMWKGSIW